MEQVIRIGRGGYEEPTELLRKLLGGKDGWILVRPDAHVAWGQTPAGVSHAPQTGGVTVGSQEGKVHLHENVTLHSSDERYQWVNMLALVGKGVVDLQKMEMHVGGYIEQPGSNGRLA